MEGGLLGLQVSFVDNRDPVQLCAPRFVEGKRLDFVLDNASGEYVNKVDAIYHHRRGLDGLKVLPHKSMNPMAHFLESCDT
jgi:hypothetical protein